jgi:hypothetical protein
MSPRTKLWFIIAVVVLVGLAIGVAASATQSAFMMPLFFGWVVVGSLLMARIKCPGCGRAVARVGSLGGIPLPKCKECGTDLTKREE